MSRLQRSDKETHPPILIFSLTTVASTNSIRTFSELRSTTCCYQGNRGSHQSVMHHQRSLKQTMCCETLKSITWLCHSYIVTKAAYVESWAVTFSNEGEFHLNKIARCRKAQHTADVILGKEGWEHEWCSPRGKWGTEMYGDNYFLQSSGLPPALVLCVPSVTDLCSPETVSVCVCLCVSEDVSKYSCSVINHYWLTEDV